VQLTKFSLCFEGLNKGEIIELARNAIDFVFADDGVKKAVAETFLAAERRLQQ